MIMKIPRKMKVKIKKRNSRISIVVFLDGAIKGTLPGEEEEETTGTPKISAESKNPSQTDAKANEDDEEDDDDDNED